VLRPRAIPNDWRCHRYRCPPADLREPSGLVEPSLVDERASEEQCRTRRATSVPHVELERLPRSQLRGGWIAGLELELRVLLGAAGDVHPRAVLADERATGGHVGAAAFQIALERPVAAAHDEGERLCHSLGPLVEKFAGVTDSGARRQVTPTLHGEAPRDHVGLDSSAPAPLRVRERLREDADRVLRTAETAL
jgi:hypothetical protein